MRISSISGQAATLLAVTLAFAGCGGAESGGGAGGVPSPGGSLKGTIQIDGSSTVFRISRAAQEAYGVDKPDVTVVVNNHGTGGGFSRYLEGEVDIVDASRTAKPEEESKAKANNLDWTRYTIGYDGITIVVNAKNDFVKALTVAQLKTIWEPDSKVKTWKDVDPSWPDRTIVLYSPDKDSGTFEFFTEAICGKAKRQRDDVQPSADDNTLVSGVAGDPDGIGYFGYAYFAANKDKLHAVAVRKNADAKAVLPAPETILDNSYAPLARPLFIYVKNTALKRPEVADFLTFYLGHAAELAEKAKYVAPRAEDQSANMQTFAEAKGAAHTAVAPAAK